MKSTTESLGQLQDYCLQILKIRRAANSQGKTTMSSKFALPYLFHYSTKIFTDSFLQKIIILNFFINVSLCTVSQSYIRCHHKKYCSNNSHYALPKPPPPWRARVYHILTSHCLVNREPYFHLLYIS